MELSGTGGERARKEADVHEKVACSLGCSYFRVGPAQLRANDLLVANAKVATATLAAARDHSTESQHASLLALMRHSPVWTVEDPRRRQPEQRAIKDEIDYSELIYLVDVALTVAAEQEVEHEYKAQPGCLRRLGTGPEDTGKFRQKPIPPITSQTKIGTPHQEMAQGSQNAYNICEATDHETMNITLRQLRYFVEVAQSRSLSRAAEHLLIAQPALSQNIASLEEDLAAKLFTRHARGVELSPAGHRLFAKAMDILSQTDALKEQVEGREGRPSGPVRLSISGSVASVLVAPLLRSMAEKYPGIELTVREGLSFESRAQVESGQAHLALMPSPSELQGMESLPLFEERFMLFGSFAAMRRKPETFTFTEVAALPLAAPDGAHDLRKIIERAASAIDRRLDVRYELNSPPMLIAVVKEGLAYSVMPPSACHEAVAARSIAGRLVVDPELSRVQAVVWPRDRPLTPASAATRDTVVQLIRELVLDGRLHGRLIEPSKKMKPK